MNTTRFTRFSVLNVLKAQPRALGLVVSALALLAVGCQQQPKSSTPPDATGTYTLATVGGQKLPCTPPHQGGAPEVRAGSITLQADGTFTSTMTYAGPGGQAGSRDFSGTYTRQGSSFKLQWKGAGTTTATLDGNIFTMNNEGLLFAYRK